jgi:hypothetical protein
MNLNHFKKARWIERLSSIYIVAMDITCSTSITLYFSQIVGILWSRIIIWVLACSQIADLLQICLVGTNNSIREILSRKECPEYLWVKLKLILQRLWIILYTLLPPFNIKIRRKYASNGISWTIHHSCWSLDISPFVVVLAVGSIYWMEERCRYASIHIDAIGS